MELTVKELTYQTPEYDAGFALRNEILRVPLGLDLYSEDLPHEARSIHCGAFFGDKLVGSMNFYEQEPGEYYLQQIVVANDLQKSGVGRKLMELMEEILKAKDVKKITMNARMSVVDFYKNLGYYTVGEPFFKRDRFPEQVRMDKDL